MFRFSLFVVFFLFPLLVIADDSAISLPQPPKRWTVEEVKAYLVEKSLEYELDPVMVLEIARCESGYRKDVVSVTNDVGLLQVNMKVHSGSMAAMGYSFSNWEDVTAYGLRLMKEQGTRPWKNSKPCHGY